MSTVLTVEHLGKSYRLGAISGGTLQDDVARWWAHLRGRPDPTLKVTRSGHGRSAGTEFVALDDVSFDVQDGEVLGIIGRNGAGKSTLLKILSQVTAPTSGVVRISGRVASLLEVGTGFHADLTGRENVFLNGAIMGMTKAEIRAKFDEIVAFSECEEFIDTPVKRYSSGMYVRLAFAVAAHLEPEILIVDEVLAVGDSRFQKKCLGKMGEVSRGGRTVLFVSHNLGIMRSLCGRALWLNKGAIVQSGRAEVVIEAYLRDTGTELASTVQLDDRARRNDWGSQIRLTRLEWKCDIPAVHTKTIAAALFCRVLRPVEDISLGIGFSTLEGIRLLTYESDYPGLRRNLAPGDEIAVDFHADDFPLPPGYYSLDIGMRSGDLHGVDYLPDVTRFEVVPGPATLANQMSSGAGVRLRSEWSWRVG